MRPVIAVTTHYEATDRTIRLNVAYARSIYEAGGLPILVPLGVMEDVEQILAMVDGVLTTGGTDIHPVHFGEEPHPMLEESVQERDLQEITLVQATLEKRMPLLGICRGHQIINVALGGTVFQDIQSQYVGEGEPLMHKQDAARDVVTHYVEIEEDSMLKGILGKTKFGVNSFHHQAVKDIAPNLRIAAKSSDGIVEALEHPDMPFFLTIQWHPEELSLYGDEGSKRILKAFIDACR